MSRNNPSTRDQILDAAATVIRNIGLGHTTTKEIASAAGLSEAALYRHFADKAELFLCVIGERVPQLVAAFGELGSRAGHRTVRSNLEDVARPDGGGLTLLREAADAMRLSARGYHRVLRVARTLADLDGANKVGRVHLAEALSYRALADEIRRAA